MTRALIKEFLAGKRVAVIGVSRSERDFSRILFREMVRRGYDAVPVNPAAVEIEGRRAFANVAEVTPAVDWALVMTAAGLRENIVRECASAGIPRVWLFGTTPRTCHDAGVQAVSGCPFMFFPRPGFPHNFHGFLLRLAGLYPK
ncbi:MAG: CoA-binding protein [Bryobacteraceae bacterium]